MFSFLDISLVDIIDILLVAIAIFYAFRLLKGSQAMSIFIATVVIFALRIVCMAVNMKLMASLLGAILDVGLLAFIVIFQPEIRRFLFSLGNTYRRAGSRARWLTRFFEVETEMESAETVNEICRACAEMSAEKCGALIVVEKETKLKYIAATGDIIDAKVSQRLLRNLFFKNSPLHDGAVLIKGDRVLAARCTLPITEKEIPASYGMRHKAAMGISEVSDAVIVVVSEETGGITVARAGEFHSVNDENDLKNILQNA